MTVDAVIQNGQVVLKTPVSLPDGLEVKVHIQMHEPSPLVWLGENAVDSGITDMAEQHDHYIYCGKEIVEVVRKIRASDKFLL